MRRRHGDSSRTEWPMPSLSDSSPLLVGVLIGFVVGMAATAILLHSFIVIRTQQQPSSSSSFVIPSFFQYSSTHSDVASLEDCRLLLQQQTSESLQYDTPFDVVLQVQRRLKEEEAFINTASSHSSSWYSYAATIAAIALCLTVAALAAGLTLGLLGMDPLLLLIKERAAPTAPERRRAAQLLPMVRQHHRLLVTLLLLNAAANEALPLFLEALVPPALAVLLSVTFVLFFGEIIPSALFTGPHQLSMAHALVPLVQVFLWLLYPIAGPIAALLDWLLHPSSENPDTSTYTRSELAALIRIQYEERVAVKRQQKHQNNVIVGALDFTPSSSRRILADHMRAWKSHTERVSGEPLVVRRQSSRSTSSILPEEEEQQQRESSFGSSSNNRDADVRWQDHSIHRDEVMMMEGALQMQTKVAMDVFTTKRRVFCIPTTMKLNERNIVKIYASGYSRIPVHLPKQPTAIVGILVTKHLIVVDPKECRPVYTLPLRTPRCVSPAMPLVDLLNMFQSGGHASRGGHLALVCARPSIGEQAFSRQHNASSSPLRGVLDTSHSNNALEESRPVLPEEAGYMGIITLEDVLEMLLQEQIYDEMDKREQKALKIIVQAIGRWRRHLHQRRKSGVVETPYNPCSGENTSRPTGTLDLMDLEATETSSLLGTSSNSYSV